jgi:hypothetical protein
MQIVLNTTLEQCEAWCRRAENMKLSPKEKRRANLLDREISGKIFERVVEYPYNPQQYEQS